MSVTPWSSLCPGLYMRGGLPADSNMSSRYPILLEQRQDAINTSRTDSRPVPGLIWASTDGQEHQVPHLHAGIPGTHNNRHTH